jgi:hypothetical protein
MVLEYEFLGRDKLVKGYTYPIRRGELDQGVGRRGNVRRMKDQFYTASLIGGKLVVEQT